MRTFILLFVLLPTIGFWQKNKDTLGRRLNHINFNLGGDGALLGLVYEHFQPVNNIFLSSKIGVGYQENFRFSGPPKKQFLTIPHHYTVNFGKKEIFFEAGLGGTLLFGPADIPYLVYPTLGIRTLPLSRTNRSNLRLYLNIPFSESFWDDIFFIPLGISFGYNF